MKPPVLNAYEVRNADYSVVHAESESDFDQFIAALNVKDGEQVIDVGGGYGSVMIRLLQRQPQVSFAYDLLDGGMFQLKKGEERISALLERHQNTSVVRYLHQDAGELTLEPEHYDLVICKMFLHELPAHVQKKLIGDLYKIIKPGGRIVVWNPHLEAADHRFFASVIRKKDELAGFGSMVQNRHFLLNDDFRDLMLEAGFVNFQKLFTFDYHLHTINRLDQEFAGDRSKLLAWNEHILHIARDLNADTFKKFNISTNDDDIYINFKRGIFSLQKPVL